MFGKHFKSMYEGSMVGKGSAFFAVWGYVIASMRPDYKGGAYVDLNARLLSMILGESEEVVVKVIEELCSPDPASRSKEKEGRRLIKVGEYTYSVVNGAKYRAIRNEEDRRIQNCEAQRRFREKKTGKAYKKGKPTSGETANQILENTQGREAAEAHAERINAELESNKAKPEPELEAPKHHGGDEEEGWERV